MESAQAISFSFIATFGPDVQIAELNRTKGQCFTNCSGFKQVHGDDGLEEVSVLETAASSELPSKGLDGASVQEHVRSEERTQPSPAATLD